MLILGFDTETDGLVTPTTNILQIGAVLWDTAAQKKKAKAKVDVLINWPDLTEIKPEAAEVNGILLEATRKYGMLAKEAFETLVAMMRAADAMCAHNGNAFDKPLLMSNAARVGVEVPAMVWVDTSCDIEYPAHIQTRKLVHLAAEHGFVNPFPHDAISDVLTMLKVADLYDWDKTMTWARSPSVIIRADSTFQQKELVKKQNYRWNGESKEWTKTIKDFQLEACRLEAVAAGFKVSVLGRA